MTNQTKPMPPHESIQNNHFLLNFLLLAPLEMITLSFHLISPFACSNLVSHYLKAVRTSPKRLCANSKCSSSKYITQLWWKTILGKSEFDSFCKNHNTCDQQWGFELWLHFRVVVWNRLGFTCSERTFFSCSMFQIHSMLMIAWETLGFHP